MALCCFAALAPAKAEGIALPGANNAARALDDALIAMELREEGLLTADTVIVNVVEVEEWTKKFRLSTSVPGWILLQANVGFEFDLAPHWSIQLPIYYGGVNWFTHSWKFRIFSLQPEARYWMRSDNMGLFVGAHVGVAWYDFAFGGSYRYQDQHRNSPAIGGGVAAGYRMALSADRRVNVAFELGVGVYHLDYDRIENVYNGKPVDRWEGMKFLIDRVAVSFSYSFNL